jgi:hypothetical protein
MTPPRDLSRIEEGGFAASLSFRSFSSLSRAALRSFSAARAFSSRASYLRAKRAGGIS